MKQSSPVSRAAIVVFAFFGLSGLRASSAQAPEKSDGSAATLARAWSAVAGGRTVDAVAAADELLRTNPRDRRAITVKVEALATTSPQRALDAYEAWLTVQPGEDLFLLEPIARGTLEGFAAGSDARLRLAALEALVRAGVPGARQRLAQESGRASDLTLARLGDTEAAARIIKAAEFEQLRPELRIEVLSLAGAPAIDPLRRFMTDRSGAVRALAVEGLGRIGGDAVVGDLKAAAADPEFHVRATANVALAALGDTQAAAAVNDMLGSPVADIQLLAARAFVGRGPGPWIDSILPLLESREGLVTLRAAELLAPFRPEAVRAALNGSAESPNPVVRIEAVRVMATTALAGAGAADLAALRRALRDAEAPVRLHAASAILAVGRSRK